MIVIIISSVRPCRRWRHAL